MFFKEGSYAHQVAFIWSRIKKKNCAIVFKCKIKIFCVNIFSYIFRIYFVYSCGQSWIFSIITPVFSVTWSFRNHSNILIYSRNSGNCNTLLRIESPNELIMYFKWNYKYLYCHFWSIYCPYWVKYLFLKYIFFKSISYCIIYIYTYTHTQIHIYTYIYICFYNWICNNNNVHLN